MTQFLSFYTKTYVVNKEFPDTFNSTFNSVVAYFFMVASHQNRRIEGNRASA